ncbi:MAG: PIG-L family deacetylase [Lachnospiraceae bacterium]|nr:PIG-L family deacetylase [Lachnospiraceae bacterium]
MSRVLVVAAHPDDELLGVGGTVIKHVQVGDEVRSIIMCEGESLRYGTDVGQNTAIQEAADVMGVSRVYQFKFPDQRLDTYTLTELITPLEQVSEEFKPDIIYCQSGSDANRDHRILFEAALVAFRPNSEWIKEFMCFYTASSTEWGHPKTFAPDTWIDISAQLDKKIEAFERYTSEVREYPHPRSSEALRHQAAFWGNQCCMEAAEVCVSIRRTLR